MSDDFLKEHQADWRAQPDEFSAVRDKLNRERWQPHAHVAASIGSAVIGVVSGLGFLWGALATGKVVFAMAAVVMLVGLPGAMAVTIFLQRKGFVWDDETPESLLRTGLRRTDAKLRTARFGWSPFALIGGFIAALWIANALGYVPETWFVIFYSIVGVVALAITWLAMRRQLSQLKRERATYARLLAEFDAEPDDGDRAP